MMAFQGVIFDFNGTLFQDSDLHEKAWNQYAAFLGKPGYTSQEFLDNFHGKTNSSIVGYLLGRQASLEECRRHGTQKEAVYREFCRQNPERLVFTKGAEDLFGYLQAKGIPFGIATSADQGNIDFYLEVFQLERWFSKESIVYDDGSLPSKPAPDIYMRAAQRIHCDIRQCLVFEDALMGIESARNAGAKAICAIAPTDWQVEQASRYKVHTAIRDFTFFDRSTLD